MIGLEYRKLNPIALGAIILEFGLLMAIGFTLAGLFTKSDNSDKTFAYNVVISNYKQEIGNVSKNDLDNILFSIYDIAWLNNKDVDRSNNIVATIRADSVKKEKYEKDDIYQLYFIVDLPELEQTFQVNYVYSTSNGYNGNIKSDYRTMSYCPKESQRVYSGQSCRDRYAGQAEEIIQDFEFK